MVRKVVTPARILVRRVLPRALSSNRRSSRPSFSASVTRFPPDAHHSARRLQRKCCPPAGPPRTLRFVGGPADGENLGRSLSHDRAPKGLHLAVESDQSVRRQPRSLEQRGVEAAALRVELPTLPRQAHLHLALILRIAPSLDEAAPLKPLDERGDGARF